MAFVVSVTQACGQYKYSLLTNYVYFLAIIDLLQLHFLICIHIC